MKKLNKSTIFAARDIPIEKVEVPEWGGTVGIRVMTGKERDRWEAAIASRGTKLDPVTKQAVSSDISGLRTLLLVMTVCDPDTGELMFDDTDQEALGARNANVLDRLFSKAVDVNMANQGGVEAAVKNS